MPRISIIGLGLIGTSLGMALRSADEKESPLGKVELVGYDEEPRHVKKARGRLAIDREARSLSEAVRDAQIVVLATPVRAMEGLLTQLASLLPAGAVVTDVASTKAQVYAWEIWPDRRRRYPVSRRNLLPHARPQRPSHVGGGAAGPGESHWGQALLH